MRHASLMLVGIAAAVILVSPADATIRITGDPGGRVADYVERHESKMTSECIKGDVTAKARAAGAHCRSSIVCV